MEYLRTMNGKEFNRDFINYNFILTMTSKNDIHYREGLNQNEIFIRVSKRKSRI